MSRNAGFLPRPRVGGGCQGTETRWDLQTPNLGWPCSSVWALLQSSLLALSPQSLSPQDRAAYKEYISNVSVGRMGLGGTGLGKGELMAAPLVPLPYPTETEEHDQAAWPEPQVQPDHIAVQVGKAPIPQKEKGCGLARRGGAEATASLPCPGVRGR